MSWQKHEEASRIRCRNSQ